MRVSKPALLLILDGWGQAPPGPGNAVSLASTPNLDALLALPSRSTLLCSGRAVGLPAGYMGNSEVGHMNIGAGRVVYQDMTRIDMAVEDGSLAANPALRSALEAAGRGGGRLHLLGLLSDGGVHSHINHLFALLDAAGKAGVEVCVHAFTDGRDTAPDSGAAFMRRLVDKLGPRARVASVSGRYYAMDRDRRWERVRKAWEAMVAGRGERFADPVQAVESAYAAGLGDEFIVPCLVAGPGEEPRLIEDGDAVFFFNFRADRAREMSRCLFDPAFDGFEREKFPRLAAFSTMTSYEASFPMPVAFKRQSLENGLGRIVSDAGLRQLRIAETEKYAHVTYFFNGGVEDPLPGEERRLVPSPREVPTYDLKPQMSVFEVTDVLIREWEGGTFDFAVCNFANLDMVGHTGVIGATVKACEAVDKCVGRVRESVKKRGGLLFLTADHGNADEMLTPEGHPQTAHSKNPVAFVLASEQTHPPLRDGKLGDIAPTILDAWGLEQPAEMTGQSLLGSPGS
ncbi:MAG: 2,3-bisphosphoglycerate-independent phosphoglycerate mutase [Desulfovibrio sp.]|jgi:2,3-bisphosphoglycerate-independent phosphoglycerate mutase|nr:2,3-bisphosphoglycerate-independent phosphoglycerate mutase [Desulfovibrio sp.]